MPVVLHFKNDIELVRNDKHQYGVLRDGDLIQIFYSYLDALEFYLDISETKLLDRAMPLSVFIEEIERLNVREQEYVFA